MRHDPEERITLFGIGFGILCLIIGILIGITLGHFTEEKGKRDEGDRGYGYRVPENTAEPARRGVPAPEIPPSGVVAPEIPRSGPHDSGAIAGVSESDAVQNVYESDAAN